MTEYDEEDLLPLSGLQHFAFCRRQWALIHIEQQWSENLRTAEGRLLHERAHDDRLTEKRGDLLVSRGMPVFSRTLGITGVCDVVEFRRDPAGVPLHGRQGLWRPTPVEYKRGAPHAFDADELQLCCQAMCLEDMLACAVPEGFLYYGEPRRRTRVILDEALRGRVRAMLADMHDLFERRRTPLVKPTKSCRACSLADLCLPRLSRTPSVSAYMQNHLEDEEAP